MQQGRIGGWYLRGEKVKTLKFPHGFNAYVIEAIKELKMENDALKLRLLALEEKVGAQNVGAKNLEPLHNANRIQ